MRVALVDFVTKIHQNVACAKYFSATTRYHAVAATVSATWLVANQVFKHKTIAATPEDWTVMTPPLLQQRRLLLLPLLCTSDFCFSLLLFPYKFYGPLAFGQSGSAMLFICSVADQHASQPSGVVPRLTCKGYM
jgi:hypothetical protein